MARSVRLPMIRRFGQSSGSQRENNLRPMVGQNPVMMPETKKEKTKWN
jgi:hypothetical protein